MGARTESRLGLELWIGTSGSTGDIGRGLILGT